jgi:hypothetical protein
VRIREFWGGHAVTGALAVKRVTRQRSHAKPTLQPRLPVAFHGFAAARELRAAPHLCTRSHNGAAPRRSTRVRRTFGHGTCSALNSATRYAGGLAPPPGLSGSQAHGESAASSEQPASAGDSPPGMESSSSNDELSVNGSWRNPRCGMAGGRVRRRDRRWCDVVHGWREPAVDRRKSADLGWRTADLWRRGGRGRCRGGGPGRCRRGGCRRSRRGWRRGHERGRHERSRRGWRRGHERGRHERRRCRRGRLRLRVRRSGRLHGRQLHGRRLCPRASSLFLPCRSLLRFGAWLRGRWRVRDRYRLHAAGPMRDGALRPRGPSLHLFTAGRRSRRRFSPDLWGRRLR